MRVERNQTFGWLGYGHNFVMIALIGHHYFNLITFLKGTPPEPFFHWLPMNLKCDMIGLFFNMGCVCRYPDGLSTHARSR